MILVPAKWVKQSPRHARRHRLDIGPVPVAEVYPSGSWWRPFIYGNSTYLPNENTERAAKAAVERALKARRTP